VAFNLLGATAASWAVVEADLMRRGVRVDRSGLVGPVIETYPAAVVQTLGHENAEGLVDAVASEIDLAPFAGVVRGNDHVRDALVAAVAARARQTEQSSLPDDELIHLARVEGWIHVPTSGLTLRDLL
jgi:predicted nuclease with RNAse H fold